MSGHLFQRAACKLWHEELPVGSMVGLARQQNSSSGFYDAACCGFQPRQQSNRAGESCRCDHLPHRVLLKSTAENPLPAAWLQG